MEWNSEKSNHHDHYTVLEALCNKLCCTVQLIAHAFEHRVFCSSLSSLLVSSKPCIFNHNNYITLHGMIYVKLLESSYLVSLAEKHHIKRI